MGSTDRVSQVKVYKSFSAGRAALNTMVLPNAPLCARATRKVQLEPIQISHGLRMQHAGRSLIAPFQFDDAPFQFDTPPSKEGGLAEIDSELTLFTEAC